MSINSIGNYSLTLILSYLYEDQGLDTVLTSKRFAECFFLSRKEISPELALQWAKYAPKFHKLPHLSIKNYSDLSKTTPIYRLLTPNFRTPNAFLKLLEKPQDYDLSINDYTFNDCIRSIDLRLSDGIIEIDPYLSDPIFNLNCLEKLSLKLPSSEHIISDNITNLSCLRSLDLKYNYLSHIPNLSNLTSLTYCNLKHNRFNKVPILPSSVQNLSLEGCGISDLLDIDSLPNLTVLNLSKNNIGTIPDCISCLTTLHFLDLSNNLFLVSISPQLENLDSLTMINIKGTNLNDESINLLLSLNLISGENFLAENQAYAAGYAGYGEGYDPEGYGEAYAEGYEGYEGYDAEGYGEAYAESYDAEGYFGY